MNARSDSDILFSRVHAEVLDSLDEELEMEVDNERGLLLNQAGDQPASNGMGRAKYFRELFRLKASW